MREGIGKAASVRRAFSQETCQLPGTGRDSRSRVIGRTVFKASYSVCIFAWRSSLCMLFLLLCEKRGGTHRRCADICGSHTGAAAGQAERTGKGVRLWTE